MGAPVGIDVLAKGGVTAVAVAAGDGFIRVNPRAQAHVADAGFVERGGRDGSAT